MFTDRQKEIIDVTLELISAEGFEKVTMKNIADELDITDAALYKHFESKDKIMLGIAHLFEKASEEILSKLVHLDISHFERVKYFFINRCSKFAENPTLTVVVFSDEMLKSNTEFSDKINKIMKHHKKVLVREIKSAQEEKEIIRNIPAEDVFFLVIGSFRLLVTRWRLNNFNFDLKSRGEQLWESIEAVVKCDHQNKTEDN